jgi:hypothetical protein
LKQPHQEGLTASIAARLFSMKIFEIDAPSAFFFFLQLNAQVGF